MTDACSQNRVQEHINVLPVRQEHINRFLAVVRYREHVDKLEFTFMNTIVCTFQSTQEFTFMNTIVCTFQSTQ